MLDHQTFASRNCDRDGFSSCKRKRTELYIDLLLKRVTGRMIDIAHRQWIRRGIREVDRTGNRHGFRLGIYDPDVCRRRHGVRFPFLSRSVRGKKQRESKSDDAYAGK